MLRIYLRVSTEEQTTRSQRHALEAWLGGRDALWYVDEGCRGDDIRPALGRLVRELRPGDTAVCFALDRMSRGGIEETLRLKRLIQTQGAKLVSLSEPWANDDNPCTDVVLAVLSWAAQQEKRRIRARQAAGIQAVRDANNGKCPWGGRRPGTRITVTPDKERAVRRLHAQGEKVAAIARQVGLSRKTVYAVLRGQE
jgi:DNA invertase Pin-like site-specific DNA recombinase